MAGIKDEVFAGRTVVYGESFNSQLRPNGRGRVQFGGSDGTHGTYPPTYKLSGEPVYDDAGRTVIYTKYTLMVQCFVVAATNANPNVGLQDKNIEDLKRILSLENQVLKIDGLGLGTLVNLKDLVWGPKPRVLQVNPFGGGGATEIIWTVDFHVKKCGSRSQAGLNGIGEYLAFNWSNTFDLDHEGLLTHTTLGYWQIPRNATTLGTSTDSHAQISDELRNNFTVPIPRGFRRTRKVFRDNAAKDRTDFVIIDQQFEADAWPPGISKASGTYSFSSNKLGFQTSTATLSMTLTTQPGQPKSVAGFFFLKAAARKAQELREQSNSSDDTNATVLPIAFGFSEKLWTRESSFSMTFQVTNTLAELLAFTQMWRPLGDQTGTVEDFDTWAASRGIISNGTPGKIDGNLGFSELKENPDEDDIINICEGNVSTIGQLIHTGSLAQQFPAFQFGCPDDITETNSWLFAKERISVMEDRSNTMSLKQAVPYVISPVSATAEAVLGTIGEGAVDMGTTTFPDAIVDEAAGTPEVKILHQFMGLRVKYNWQMQRLEEYGGKETIDIGSLTYETRQVACVLGCPIVFGRGYRIYKVRGHLSDFQTLAGPTTECAAPLGPGPDEVKKNPTRFPN